ncbi:MAG TPA: hypothetical protein DCM32_00190 [Xanthomonadaceae bacterium]|nr:hypothetical protein [Xanthomonadaceae bacterium]
MDLPLRPLLIDCRLELRKSLRHYEQTDLAQRLEAALSMLAERAAAAPSARSGAQVAYAWQMAARHLKASHPGLFNELQKEVQRLLDAGEAFADAGAEIERLRQDLEAAEASAGAAKLARMKATAQLNAVCKTLAAAAPQVAETGDAQSTALARVEALLKGQGATPAVLASAVGSAADSEAVPPPVFVLERVRAGERGFTKAQREFAVAEAMIVTGWQFTPVELLDRGEPWLAGLLLQPDAHA